MTDELRQRIDAALRDFFAAAVPAVTDIAGELEPLAAAGERFVVDGGKRLRPAFCYWGHRAAGGTDSDAIIRASAALELLHAGALVHDDVIDDSDSRRGAAAVHRQFADRHRAAGWEGDADRFGVATAILLGDLALIWADEMLTGSGFDPADLHRALPVWAAMRVEVMCGQYLDMEEQARGGGSVDRALRVARFKSAKYTIERPLHLGVALAAQAPALTTGLSAFGLPLGEAFQLRDDVLGVFGDPTLTGKPAGDDLREGKRTVLVAFATERADDAQRATLSAGLGNSALDDDGIVRLQQVLTDTGAVARVEDLIARRLDQALAGLDALALDRECDAALRRLATAVSQRDL